MSIDEKSKIYDFVKVIVTILVVIAHITRLYTGNGVLLSINKFPIFNIITKFIYSFHMPLFMMISGAVYNFCIFDLNKYKDKNKFFINKVKRLLIPYFIIGCFYVAPVMVIFKFSDYNFIQYIVKGIIIPVQNRHLWFLLYLFIYQLYYYILLKNTNKVNLLLINILISTLIYYLNIPLVSDIFYYLIFFLIGNILNDKINLLNKYSNIVIITTLFIIYFVLCIVYNGNMFFKPVIAVIASFSFLLLVLKKLKMIMKVTKNSVFAFFKKNSMAIYLFHPMIIYIFYLYLDSVIIHPILIFTLCFFLSINVSLVFAFLLRILKLKFVMGE